MFELLVRTVAFGLQKQTKVHDRQGHAFDPALMFWRDFGCGVATSYRLEYDSHRYPILAVYQAHSFGGAHGIDGSRQ